MFYALIDHKMTSLNVQNSSVARGFTAKFWRFCGVILVHIRVLTIENCRRFVFYNNKEKVREELALYFVEKRTVTSGLEPISDREFWQLL